MTERKLQKYLNKTLPPIVGSRKLTPVILTDSKAKYLIRHCSSTVESQIRWRFRSGQSTERGFQWLNRNLDREIGHLDNIHLYVWLGTCDLTDYDGKFVTLAANKDIVDSLINTYQKFIDLLKPYPACKLTFFEIPPYSIIDFNKSRKHSDPKSFKKDEEDILANIIKVNEHIRHINTSLNTFSPIFGADVSHHHSEKTSKSKKITLRDNYLFNLYLDGIHPDENLARVWLKKIAFHIQKDCWG